MQAELINPFLTSSIQVIETLANVRPTVGQLQLKRVQYAEHCVWLKINIHGQVERDIIFGFPERMAMNMVSAMLGGYTVTGLDDMCRSAVAELGNMICGNASTMMNHRGIHVDITPPQLMDDSDLEWGQRAVSIPLTVGAIGEFDIHIIG